VTDRDPSPIDAALDLLIYAPAGLALTVGEEIPKLAAKGRARLAGPFGVASMVGRFAVAQGRRELDKRFGVRPSAGPSGNGSPAEPGAADDVVGDEVVADDVVADDVVGDDVVGDDVAAGGLAADETAEHLAAGDVAANDVVADSLSGGATEAEGVVDERPVGVVEEAAVAPSRVPPASAAPAVESLAIHGYDSLSASQVVQRLAGLSGPELEAVRAYESAGRGRRTILARIAQLQGG